MTSLQQIIQTLDLKIFSGAENIAQQIHGGYASDLLSDVLAHAHAGQIWVTVQTHTNVLAVAAMRKLAAVVLVNGLEPDEELLEKNKTECIPILGTKLSSFEMVGKLYVLLQTAS